MHTDHIPVRHASQRAYGEVVYWLTFVACLVCLIGPVLIMAFPARNVLNPYHLFAAIFRGSDAATVWQEVGGGFPGAHFYLSHPFTGDGLTYFGLAILGCTAAVWGLLAASVVYYRERNYVYVGMALWVVALVALAVAGVFNGME